MAGRGILAVHVPHHLLNLTLPEASVVNPVLGLLGHWTNTGCHLKLRWPRVVLLRTTSFPSRRQPSSWQLIIVKQLCPQTSGKLFFFIPPPPSERTAMVSLPPISISSSRQKSFLYRGLDIALSSEPAKVALSIEFYFPLFHPFLSWNEGFLHPPSPHACALEGPASLPPECYGWGLRRRTPT